MSDRYTSQDDDLPRTVKREKAARAAATADPGQSRGSQFDPPPRGSAGYTSQSQPASFEPDYPGDLQPVAVERFNVPFFRLAWFLIKCVLAGIPALMLLFAILWGFGQALQKFAPALVKLRILISFQ
jgi:hypothetical protein